MDEGTPDPGRRQLKSSICRFAARSAIIAGSLLGAACGTLNGAARAPVEPVAGEADRAALDAGQPATHASKLPGLSGFSAADYCDRAKVHDAGVQDRLLRFAAIVRETLAASGNRVAIISRTGMNLERIGVRFSHAGVAMRTEGEVPWTVRQLYYACDEGRPRLFDQGLAGFLFNTDDPASGHVSIVFPTGDDSARLERIARDDRRALRLLAARYSANAYPFSVRYQNCNQWVIELLASGWGELADGDDLRERAQAWLGRQGYDPAPLVLGSHWLKLAASFSPMVHLDDHPASDQPGLQFRLSLPESIETFVHERDAGATRIELCHERDRVVVRHGWQAIADGCVPQAGDTVRTLTDR